MDDGWCEGELRGRHGMFPDNFVKVRQPAAVASTSAPVHHPPPPSDTSSSSVQLRSELGRFETCVVCVELMCVYVTMSM